MNEAQSAVTILIKAPNQMVEDQSIECERSWTVKELKVHLSNVYPSKPHPDGQKLIYSGKLLSDCAVLSDILRTYDGLENNTIHLVCSTKDIPWIPNVVTTPTKPDCPPITEAVPNPTWPSANSFAPPRYPTFAEDVNQDVRRRFPTSFPGTMNNVPHPYNYYSQENMNRHIMWVQQAYMQYVTQYMQMSNGRYYLRPGNNGEQQHAPQPVNEAPPQNQVEEEPEEENHVNRDWLEWVYIISRLLVLTSVVYFYSSPLRFMLVMAVALILFSIDLERWRRRNNGNNPEQEHVISNEDERPNEDLQERPHWFAIVWTFLSSFFLSLIPDQRDVP